MTKETKKLTIQLTFDVETEDWGDGEVDTFLRLAKVTPKKSSLTPEEASGAAERFAQSDSFYERAVPAIISAVSGATTQFYKPI